jgi:hypothetical protein
MARPQNQNLVTLRVGVHGLERLRRKSLTVDRWFASARDWDTLETIRQLKKEDDLFHCCPDAVHIVMIV